jgi:hypothetical protein
MKTTTTAIEMVINAGVTTAEEIFYFVMNKNNGITVPMLEEGLVEMMVAFKKKDTKEVKANFFARALEMDIEEYTPATCNNCKTVLGEEVFENVLCGPCYESIMATHPSNQSAAVETTVAEVKQIEEEVLMTKEGISKQQLAVNAAMLNKSKVTQGSSLDMLKGHTAYENPAVIDMLAKVNAAKDKYVRNVGENGVTVEVIDFYPERKEASRVQLKNRQFIREFDTANGGLVRILGEVTVRMPEGYAQIKVWNKNKVNSKGKLGAPEFIDFVGYDINLAKRQFNMRRPLATGSGLVVLSIIEFVDADGVVSPLSVSLPTEKGKDGTRYHIFQTNDARFVKTKNAEYVDEPLYVRDNNDQFNAAVTAFVQLYVSEFMQANPRNHHGFSKSECVNKVRFQTKDGVMDDEHMVSKKSRTILEQPDVMQLAQAGSEQPNTYCMVKDEWLDLEAVEILNEAETMERQGAMGRDEDGEERYQRHDEITIAGKLVKRQEVRKMAIEKKCAACPFYCGNSAKSESQVAKERTDAREAGKSDYVNSFFREKPKAKAQAVQTLVTVSNKDAWVTAYPYELLGKVDDIKAVRVKSAGMTVYGSDEVMANMDPEYVVPVEAFDARHANVMKDINRIFWAAFNLDKLSESQAELIFELADSKPEDLTEKESAKWDNAVHWLTQALGWAAEREAARNIAPFTQKFFAGIAPRTTIKVDTDLLINDKETFLTRPAKVVELHVEDIMGDTLYRAENDMLGWGLGYDDLNAAEFVRYLDEVAIDYVYDVILNGTTYAIVGGEDKDKELASGALQEMLQRELNYTWVRGVRRDANQSAALAELKVSKEAKDYIATVVGLKK